MNEEKAIKDYQNKLQEKEVKKFKEATSNYYVLCYIDKLEKENQQLKQQLQQKENIINKVKEELKIHLNAKSYGNHKYELFSREYLEDLLEILDNKGE